MEILSLIGRETELFVEDIAKHEADLNKIVSSSTFLVIGGAGSIGQAVTREIFKRNPKKLHVVDISENNLVELVRDLRSSVGYISGEFKTFALDCGSDIYDAFIKSDGKYDYVLNLSALKHVRSEKDPYTLMRMVDVNVWELINLANKHQRVNILQPSAGVGGHYIAVDPYFIVTYYPMESKIIGIDREVNNYMAFWCAEKIQKEELKNLN